MPRKSKTIIGEKDISCVSAQRTFTDREEPQKLFLAALEAINSKDYHILTFYGVGGIGKSSLQKHLMQEHLSKDKHTVYTKIDFDLEENRQPYRAYSRLAQNFKGEVNIDFTAFTTAFMIYISKAFPEQELKKESLPFVKEGSIIASLLDTVAGSSVSVVVNTMGYFFEKYKESGFGVELRDELNRLNQLNIAEIESRLPIFFAYDIDRFKQNNPDKRVVVFIDTYEALWTNKRTPSNRISEDNWVRDFVSELKGVLFVICGREKLIWQEDDRSWQEDLDQHLIGILSEADAYSFLNSCNIENQVIKERIIEDSKGVPFYLDLSVDTFYAIKNRGKEPSADDFKLVGQSNLFERFTKYLTISELATLKKLAFSRFYNNKIFSLIVDQFKTAYPASEMDQLNELSFISKEDNRYKIHSLMRDNLIHIQSEKEKKEANRILFEHYNEKLNSIDIKNITQEQQEAISEALYHKIRSDDIENAINWYLVIFETFYQATQYKVLEEATIELKEFVEKDTLHDALIKNNLALLYESQGKYDEVESYYLNALKIQEEVLGSEHPGTAITYNNLAGLYRAQGRYEEAEFYYLKALIIREEVLGTKHLDTAITYNNLALLYHSQGRYDEVESYYLKALKIQEEVLRTKHSDTAITYNNLALLYHSQGRYKEAEECYLTALKISKEVLGAEHPMTATTYNSLAELYRFQDRHEEVEVYHLNALKIRREVLGVEHPDTAQTYNNLALLYYSQGKYKEAEKYYLSALKIREKVLGTKHPDTAITYNNLGLLYHSQDRYKVAEEYYLKDLKISEVVLGSEHPDTAITYSNLAGLYRAQGRYEEAEFYYLKALKIRVKVLGTRHPDTAETYNNLATFYYKIQKFDLAYNYMKKAVEVLQKILPKDHPNLLNAKEELKIIKRLT